MYIDTHCHLNFEAFEKDWREVVKKAKKGGVEKMVVVGTEVKSSKRAVEMTKEVEGVYASVGFHPHHCKGSFNLDEVIGELKRLAKNKKVAAIGECGLDYHVYKKTKYSKTKITEGQKNLQKKVFGKQIQLAKELELPMIIHNREAQKEILDVMDHFCKSDGKYPKGVFHCISGGVKYLKKVLEKGFYVGVDGNVTYSDEVKFLVKEIPIDRLLLETDSPYLLPEPLRSKYSSLRSGLKASLQERTLIDRLRNEPVNVKIVADSIADIKNVSLDRVKNQTTKNSGRLFKI